jgi:hypothetical protein
MMVQRSVKHPYMTLFDGADANTSTAIRNSSLTPLQALYFLNSSFPKRCADHLAELLDSGQSIVPDGLKTEQVSSNAAAKAPDEKSELDRAFLIIYGRLPEKPELERSMQFMIQAMYSSNEFMFVE